MTRGKCLPDDIFLLCSDGLTDMVEDSAICEVLGSANNLTDKVEQLIECAKKAGGNDNITVILCQVLSPMRWIRRLLPVVLMHLLCTSGFCEVAPVDLGAYPVPVAEAGEFVATWFKDDGYAVVAREYSNDGTVRVHVSKSHESYGVVIRPQSPLGSLVQVIVLSDAGALPSAITGLKVSLKGYVARINRDRNNDPQLGQPDQVLSQSDAVYCLKASSKGETIRFSGFALDRQGLIISTAHDLEGIHAVTVTGADGAALQGKWLSGMLCVISV